ncbi:MAG: transporter substrate-binding domain-containing protein [Anaerotignum sp.]|nr:transporter substrate-binding domain-containing protein [Anaerotignum sp.]
MKKFMKSLLATTMVFAMMTSLVGCGGGSEAEAPADETATLVMATNAAFPPYEFYEGDAIVGIDAEIGAAIAEKLGMDFVIEDMEFDAIIPAVTSGKASFGMAGMTVTEERLQSVDFSDSYAKGVQVVIVAEGSAITSVDDLFAEGASNVIGVQTGTTGDLYSTWDLEDAGLATVERFNKGADAVLALTQGKVDCVVIDNEPAKEFVAANEGLVILDTEYAVEDYAICFAKDSELTAQVNGALQELIADGTVQAIIDTYISAE